MSMDALKFLRERKRMCDSYTDCKGCPFNDSKCVINSALSDDDYERITATVERWSAEHPIKTRQSVFLEQWPNASVDEGGVLFCPKTVDRAHICRCKDKGCSVCRREFWSQEVE